MPDATKTTSPVQTLRFFVYGRTLNTYAFIQGLINGGVESHYLGHPWGKLSYRKVRPIDQSDPSMQEDFPNIYPDAFQDENLR